jgi:hypothetical protein
MKLILIILSTLTLNSCGATKKESSSENIIAKEVSLEDTKLEKGETQTDPIAIYDSHTRGYHYTYTVYETYATVVKEYKGKPENVAVVESDIADLKKIIAEISVDKIGTYEAPTKKRHYDGAPHTTISIFKKGEKYSSQTFDGGFPPKALEVLVNKVLSLSAEK